MAESCAVPPGRHALADPPPHGKGQQLPKVTTPSPPCGRRPDEPPSSGRRFFWPTIGTMKRSGNRKFPISELALSRDLRLLPQHVLQHFLGDIDRQIGSHVTATAIASDGRASISTNSPSCRMRSLAK